MLAFIDESGDTGRKIQQGSSEFFTVGVVIFDDNDEALRCDQAISSLREEMSKPQDFEFHFTENSKRVKAKFIELISRFNFYYLAVSINKDPAKLTGEGFNHPKSFYKYACGLVLMNASQYLHEANIKIDKSGNRLFQGELSKNNRQKIDGRSGSKIKKFKSENSKNNNLLQLADYITGIVSRKIKGKPDGIEYYKKISAKELNHQIWPK